MVWGDLRWAKRTLRVIRAGLGHVAVKLSVRTRRLSRPLLLAAGVGMRRRQRHLTSIGVTGSCGKTATTELIAAVLRTRHGVVQTREGWNTFKSVFGVIVRTRRRDRYAVHELGATGPDSLDELIALARPEIGVVTTIGDDHVSAFGTLEATAKEKAKLVAALPPHGWAILNADDPRVAAMREVSRARVLTYGRNETADLRAIEVTSDWPGRLRLLVRHAGDEVRVETQLCGEHQVTAVLAALATAVACGIPLRDAAIPIAAAESPAGRMQPVVDPHGVTFIRDDWKASHWTIEPALAFMEQAKASRKIVVLGTISDYRGDARRKYVAVARRASAVADYVFFVGPWASRGLGARRGPDDDTIRAFPTVKAAHEFCQTFLQRGDLVLLKGSNPADHLGRLLFARQQPVACWRDRCGRKNFCDRCVLVTVPSEPAIVGTTVTSSTPALARRDEDERACVIVGLGNPGAEYAGTRHNVGRDVVCRMAESADEGWEPIHRARRLSATVSDCTAHFVTLATPMNATGDALREVLESLGLTAQECILVYDDLDLPLGEIRVRAKGSDGGHRGVRSIIHALQTESIRRVRIGVGRPKDAAGAVGHVLATFTDEERARIDHAIGLAGDRLRQLVTASGHEQRTRQGTAA